MLGNKKNYWHWIYACLKSTKGLGDGLKFVQANKEVGRVAVYRLLKPDIWCIKNLADNSALFFQCKIFFDIIM